jgi:hypothetical protein
MRTLPITASDEEIKQLVRDWVGLLAEEKYAQAVDMISAEVPEGSGSVDSRQVAAWTPELLQNVISNYGIPEPWEGQEQVYRVVPIAAAFEQLFEDLLKVDRDDDFQDDDADIGMIHVDLPLNYVEGDGLSDLTARFDLCRINKNEMVLVLHDIHVL